MEGRRVDADGDEEEGVDDAEAGAGGEEVRGAEEGAPRAADEGDVRVRHARGSCQDLDCDVVGKGRDERRPSRRRRFSSRSRKIHVTDNKGFKWHLLLGICAFAIANRRINLYRAIFLSEEINLIKIIF